MPLNRDAVRVIFLIVGIAAGTPLFLIGLYSNIDSIIFRSKAGRTEGFIQDVQASATNFSWGPVYTYNYYVEFNLGGKIIHAHTPGTGTRYDVGQSVPLLYDPADPEHARLEESGRDLFMNSVAFIPGLALLTAAVIILYRMRQGAYR
jgi:hypothetical protein